jgi:hypothetical protein
MARVSSMPSLTISCQSYGRGATSAGHALGFSAQPAMTAAPYYMHCPLVGFRRCLDLLYLSECEDAFGRAILKLRRIEQQVCEPSLGVVGAGRRQAPVAALEYI